MKLMPNARRSSYLSHPVSERNLDGLSWPRRWLRAGGDRDEQWREDAAGTCLRHANQRRGPRRDQRATVFELAGAGHGRQQFLQLHRGRHWDEGRREGDGDGYLSNALAAVLDKAGGGVMKAVRGTVALYWRFELTILLLILAAVLIINGSPMQ